ncbi:Prolyl 3-hydroxylase ogfod1 [Cichlidogyrus casuarinus]|uniref:Prolyl 3-hydroxylase ogfod1 n=1 Tax=Cichlidogyrus casuarinus TaxID=1844966 RepID=A0ABD2Q497_9PLAT
MFNYLLCHDDQLDSRKVAFIYYLVDESWSEKDGGSLSLLDNCPSDQFGFTADVDKKSSENISNFHPWCPAQKLIPKFNSLAFFEVCTKSFHSVNEILSDKPRLSINGWFHADPLPESPRDLSSCLKVSRMTAVEIEQSLVYEWINPVYLDMEQQKKIQKRFIKSSEIQLTNFIAENKWLDLHKSLTALQTWTRVGPMDLRNYSLAPYPPSQDLGSDFLFPDQLRQLLRLFASEAMQVILSDLTRLKLLSISEVNLVPFFSKNLKYIG